MKMKFVLILSLLTLTWGIALADTTTQELEARVAQLEAQLKESAPGEGHFLSDRIKIFGAVELDYSHTSDSDTSDNTVKESSSDLSLGTVELGLEAQLHDWVTATVLLLGEDLDSEDRITWDEVFMTFQRADFPVYVVAGKRCQPFGVYESLFINDPVTQDLYEINKTGVTVGYANENAMGLDLSLTLYKGDTLIQRVHDAEYGWDRDTLAGYDGPDHVNAFIVSAGFSPAEGLNLSVFFNSEPGDSDRNTTLGAALHWEGFNFMADAEYIGALNREKHRTDNREYKEKAWTLSLGYQVADPFLVAVRWEGFDPDKTVAEGLEFRYGLGLTYTLLETDAMAAFLMGEYRRCDYETTAASSNDADVDELFARLALEF